jgi:hypothetical protein
MTMPDIFLGGDYGPGYPPAPVYGFFDDFERGNSATLGATSGEQKPWLVRSTSGVPTAGIDAGAAYLRTSAGFGTAVVDANLSNGELEVNLNSPLTGGITLHGQVALRAASSADFIRADVRNDGRITLAAVTAGSAAGAISSLIGAFAGGTLRFMLSGPIIQVYAGTTLIHSASFTQHQNATAHGFVTATAADPARWGRIGFR